MQQHNEQEERLQTEEKRSRERPSRRWFLQRSLVGAGVVVPLGLLAGCGTPGTMQKQLGAGILVTPGATDTPTAAAISTPTAAATETPTAAATDTPTAAATETPTAEAGGTPTPGGTAAATGIPITQISNASSAFNEIMQDENEHVTALKDAITKAGGTPRPKPLFKGLRQLSVDTFAQTAQTLENVGVGAYLNVLPQLTAKNNQSQAASILTVEGRHAGFVGGLLGNQLSPNGAFDSPTTQADVVTSINPYIASLNGGSDPAAKLTSDVDVLNFALLLEYLESEFYNNNVSRLFK